MKTRRNAVSLIELMVGLVLVTLVILGLSNIELFSRNIFFHTDKKIKVQNDVAYVLQHMGKFIARGIADPANDAINVAPVSPYNANEMVRDWTDSEPDGVLNTTTDTQVAYIFDPAANEVLFFSDYIGEPAHSERLSANVLHFNVSYNAARKNVLAVAISGCANITGCGSSRDNPQVNLSTVIFLPSVTSE